MVSSRFTWLIRQVPAGAVSPALYSHSSWDYSTHCFLVTFPSSQNPTPLLGRSILSQGLDGTLQTSGVLSLYNSLLSNTLLHMISVSASSKLFPNSSTQQSLLGSFGFPHLCCCLATAFNCKLSPYTGHLTYVLSHRVTALHCLLPSI